MSISLIWCIYAKMPVRCNGRKKNYQTLIANKGRILYMHLCFTLSINFKSSNLSYDDLTLHVGHDDIQTRLFDETVVLI
jgi:hypothetical protein